MTRTLSNVQIQVIRKAFGLAEGGRGGATTRLPQSDAWTLLLYATVLFGGERPP